MNATTSTRITSARRILSKAGVNVSLCLAAAAAHVSGNGASTIRVEVVGENFQVRTVDSIINTGFLLPTTDRRN